MILYFTGTGNSRYVANMLASDLKDEIVSINEIFKDRKKLRFSSEKPYIIVAPIYAWRLPKKIEEFIRDAVFENSKQIYVVATMGTHFGRCDIYCKRIIEKKSMKFMGFRGVQMPDNYVTSDVMMTKEEAVNKIKASIPHIHEIAQNILQGLPLNQKDDIDHPKLRSGFINWGFNTFAIKPKLFTVSNECLKCGMCINGCPMNNISYGDDGNIKFGNKCMWCLACIQMCPKQAIDYKNRTKQNGRYKCPEVI